MSGPDVTQFVSKMNSLDGSNIKQVLEQTVLTFQHFVMWPADHTRSPARKEVQQ